MSTIGPIPVDEKRYGESLGRRYISWRSIQTKYESKPRDFSKPLPYSRRVQMKVLDAVSFDDRYGIFLGNTIAVPPFNYVNDLRAEELRCRQKAYGKLVGKVKAVQNGWGENLAQRKQTFEMMLLRISTLTQAARALKRGDIRGFLRALGITRSRTRSRARKASEIWLEYHFGWEPLYKDIYDGCKHLGHELPWGDVSASAKEKTFRSGGKASSGYSGAYTAEAQCIVKLRGVYYVDNPGGYLLNSLGVLNPISIAWELVPFSFAVDWFIPVGQYLQSLTDFVGVHSRDEFTSVFKTVLTTESRDDYFFIRKEGFDMRRALRVERPPIVPKLYRGFSVVRGVTAIALLVGTLKSLG